MGFPESGELLLVEFPLLEPVEEGEAEEEEEDNSDEEDASEEGHLVLGVRKFVMRRKKVYRECSVLYTLSG